MTAKRLLILGLGWMAASLATVSPAESAQDVQQTFQGGPPGLQGPGPRQLPPRDGRGPAQATGTSAIRGRVFAADTKRPLRRARITVNAPGLGGDGRMTSTDADGRVPDDWIVKAIMQDGRDVTDTVFEPTNGDALSGFQIVVSDRVTTLSGQITDDKGAPLTDGTVLVFSSDTSKWADDSRYVQAARPDQQGKYQIRGLPPGEYLAAAIDYVEEGVWNDPEYLESIRGLGQRFTLAEADTHALMLRLLTPP